jgi:hypothetical protein
MSIDYTDQLRPAQEGRTWPDFWRTVPLAMRMTVMVTGRRLLAALLPVTVAGCTSDGPAPRPAVTTPSASPASAPEVVAPTGYVASFVGAPEESALFASDVSQPQRPSELLGPGYSLRAARLGGSPSR